MMLFEAVDRAFGIDSTDIPNNVEHVVYARRDRYAFTRNSFGNCGTKWHAPTKRDVKYFRGTHGAIGGCPWPIPRGGKATDFISEFGEATPTLITYAQDADVAQAVWASLDRPRLLGCTSRAEAVVS
jgi:hypothetical protein